MNQHSVDTVETLESISHPTRWSRALGAAAGVALLIGGLAACGTESAPPSAGAPVPDDAALVTSTVGPTVATIPDASTTTVVAGQAECRPETAPTGLDAYGVRHTGEKICTWGPEMVSRIDTQGFLVPSQNHPVDLAMVTGCWSAAGRVYLRTPASDGWACIGGSPSSTTLTTTTPAATTPPTPAPALSAASTVTLRGLGPVRVGMTVSEASAAAGTPIVLGGAPGDTCAVGRPDGGPDGVSFMFLSGRVARVDITGGEVKTLSGAGIGDSESAVQALYSGVLQVSPHKYLPTGNYLTLVPSDAADADLRLIFETDGSSVTRFRAGAEPGVSFVEGCS